MTALPSNPSTPAPDGLVRVTDTMDPEMVLDAYAAGMFPWSTNPVRWYSPDPRAVFEPDRIHLSHSLQRVMRSGRYRVTFDSAFTRVVQSCAEAHAAQRVWISDLFIATYSELHRLGYAHSAEVWDGDDLVGGIYGLQIGGMFAGESMFHTVDNGSKIAFAYLTRHVLDCGVTLIDTQVLNNHTRSLGAVLIPRGEFMRRLTAAMRITTRFDGRRWPTDPEPWSRREPTRDGGNTQAAVV